MDKRRVEVVRYVKKWQKLLLLDAWDVEIVLEERNKEDNPSTLAEINTRGRYLEATMLVYPHLWDETTATYREGTIAHELAHVVVNPLEVIATRMLNGTTVNVEQYQDALERVTEHVTRAMSRRP
jgi:hypothetical protein